MEAPLSAGAMGSNESTCDLHGTVLSIGGERIWFALCGRRKCLIFFQNGRRSIGYSMMVK